MANNSGVITGTVFRAEYRVQPEDTEPYTYVDARITPAFTGSQTLYGFLGSGDVIINHSGTTPRATRVQIVIPWASWQPSHQACIEVALRALRELIEQLDAIEVGDNW